MNLESLKSSESAESSESPDSSKSTRPHAPANQSGSTRPTVKAAAFACTLTSLLIGCAHTAPTQGLTKGRSSVTTSPAVASESNAPESRVSESAASEPKPESQSESNTATSQSNTADTFASDDTTPTTSDKITSDATVSGTTAPSTTKPDATSEPLPSLRAVFPKEKPAQSLMLYRALEKSKLPAVTTKEMKILRAYNVQCKTTGEDEKAECDMSSRPEGDGKAKSYKLAGAPAGELSNLLFGLPVTQGDSGAISQFVECRNILGAKDTKEPVVDCSVAIELDYQGP